MATSYFYIIIISIMTDSKLIQQYLPKDLWESALKYDIPSDFVAKMPETIELVLRSKSIESFEDRQSWFALLPLMNEEQMSRLKDILAKEKTKLAEIESAYNQKKIEIKKKYLTMWQDVAQLKKIEAIQSQEAIVRAQEDAQAEALLSNL